MNISYNRSILFSVVLCISMILPVKAAEESPVLWPYYAGAVLTGVVIGGATVTVVQKPVDHASEKFARDLEGQAEKFVNFLLENKEQDLNSKPVDDAIKPIEKSEQVPPIKKVSAILKDTIKEAEVDFSQHLEQSGHQLTVDLAQNVGRMMLSYTLGLFGAFFAYKQIVDYFAFQEKIDHLDIVAQEQNMFLLPQGNFASFLQKREAALIAAKRTHLEHEQNRKFYLAGCGTLTFAAACGLCSYWIQ